MNKEQLLRSIAFEYKISARCRTQQKKTIEELLPLFEKVDRKIFLPPDVQEYAYDNVIIPLFTVAKGTCSQPSAVLDILEKLELYEGAHVLEIGTGCGYHAALTAEAIGPGGCLTSIEVDEKMFRFGKENLEKYFGSSCASRVHLLHGDGSNGLEAKQNSYDRIYYTAAAHLDKIPVVNLIKQLRNDGGILLFPDNRHELVIIKTIPGYMFIPLTGGGSWQFPY